jgi:hypothetical protein
MMNTHFRSMFRALGVLMLAAILSSCASGPNIITNADPTANFMSLQTFDFLQPLSTDNGNIQTLLSTQLIAATTEELAMRGWRREQSNPDVLINFMLETHEQIRSRPASASMSTMHRSGRYGGWGASMSTPTIEQTTQGALSIDMIDPTQNAMIWEGTATARVTDRLRQNQEQAVREFVKAILADFP